MVNYNEFIKKEETRKKIALYLYSKQKIELQNLSFVLPKRLFRYSGINKYFIDNLEKGTLTLSNPNLFNDLYDATLHNNSFQNHYNSEMERIELLQMLGISEKETISIGVFSS